MRRIIVLLIALLPTSLYSQINWVYDYEQAQKMSITKGKLIVVDFYASWCAPCKTMDKELWSKPEMKRISDSLIFLKIDLDKNRYLATKFNIRAIPHVVVINITEDILWERNGYMGNSSFYIESFGNMPGNVTQLNQRLLPFFNAKETIQDNFELGKAYQTLGKTQTSISLKNTFLNLSDKNFKKVEKKNTEQSKEAELRILLNMVYDNKAEKVLSKFEKFPADYFSQDLTDLTNYVKALCHHQLGEKEAFLEKLSSIKDPVIVKELNSLKEI
jgi:thiol-disulfide isomerase/thioredoxin